MLQSAYSWSLVTIYVVAAAVFVTLFFVSAPYGRYQRRGWGPTVAARTAWVVMELPAVVVILACSLPGGVNSAGLVALLFLILWEVHYVYRTFIFPLLMRGGTKKFPIVLVVFAMIFNSANGYVNGYNLFLSGRMYAMTWFADPRFIAGLALFLFGFVSHVGTDRALRRLRGSGEEGYKVPRGGLFEYVSAPNYFGEIVQWIGWGLMTWSFAGLSFAVFTIANLLPRGIHHHRWYRSTFENYPQNRRAVIPYLL